VAKRSRKIVKPTLSKCQNWIQALISPGYPGSFSFFRSLLQRNQCCEVCPKCFYLAISGKDVSSGLCHQCSCLLIQVSVTNAPACSFRSLSPMLLPAQASVPNAPACSGLCPQCFCLLTKGSVSLMCFVKHTQTVFLQFTTLI
jgi:hypothetical protein